ncbi:MAG TPA: ABC transporter substrate-binding protein [Candidatus Acidoferrales bacterium]|nr:ABC transporter substrate-binding protein [Candidatus Acidoferrales bacterium]
MSLFLAAISVVVAAAPAFTARRPHYGGTLVVEEGAALNSVDASTNPGEARVKGQIDSLIYDRKNADDTSTDPGPFRLAQWEPGKDAVLAANEDYKGGRPFVDAVEIRMGRSATDRLIDVELGKADVAEIPVDQARRAAESGVRISASEPDQLIALVFETSNATTGDPRIREALARSIDRAAMVNFILQKEGEPAGGLLPQWSSGTAFLFSTAPDPARVKELLSQIGPSPKIGLGYDSGDPLLQAIGERIAVNARAAGISVTPEAIFKGGTSKADARLVRLDMASAEPRTALASFIENLKPTAISNEDREPLPDPATPEQIYEREASVVRSFSVIPVAWAPHVYGLSGRVRDWTAPKPGEPLPLANVWLDQVDAVREKRNP